MMRTNIILIDFENIQPGMIGQLALDHFRAIVFVGANQNKLPFDLVASLQKVGPKVEYCKISGNGSNALDFHIAYYVGILSAADPTACFHIVSGDAGFDPLIQHLRAKNIIVNRVKRVIDIPCIKAANAQSLDERVEVVIDRLSRPRATRPGSVKSLGSMINSTFHKQQLSDEDIANVIDSLAKLNAITVDETKVTYAI